MKGKMFGMNSSGKLGEEPVITTQTSVHSNSAKLPKLGGQKYVGRHSTKPSHHMPAVDTSELQNFKTDLKFRKKEKLAQTMYNTSTNSSTLYKRQRGK